MLEEKIYKDYVAAMKARDRFRSEFINFLRSEIKKIEMSMDKGKKALEDNEILIILSKQKKRLEEAKSMIPAGERPESVSELEKQILILDEYLPKAMSDEELIKEIQ